MSRRDDSSDGDDGYGMKEDVTSVKLERREAQKTRSQPWVVYKVPQEVMEQLLEVDQPNISLSVPVNGSYPCIPLRNLKQSLRREAN